MWLLGDLQQNVLTLMLPCLGVQARGSLVAQEWRQTHGIGFLMQICICHLLPVDIIRCGITVLVGAASQLLSAESKG